MKSVMAIPCVNRNGTAKQELMEQLSEATHALLVAKHALGRAAPHASDYHGSWSYEEALEQHAARVSCVEVLIKHLGIIALGIARQNKEIAS